MILNKKGFMMLPLAALLFATSCAKSISVDEAQKNVDDYSTTETKDLKNLHAKFSIDAKDDDTKNAMDFLNNYLKTQFGIELSKSGDNYKYEGDTPFEEKENPQPTIKVLMSGIGMTKLPDPEQLKDYGKLTYSAKGTSLSANMKAESLKGVEYTLEGFATINIVELDAEGSISVDDKGYPTSVQIKATANVTVTMLSPVLNGESQEFHLNFANGEISANATYY